MTNKILWILCLVAATTAATAQPAEPLLKLYRTKANEINCIAIQCLLKKMDKNINATNCKTCSYDGFYSKIPYTKTKAIAQRITDKKKALEKDLTTQNIESKLQALLDFAVPAINNPTAKADDNTAAKKILSSLGAQTIRETTDELTAINTTPAATASTDPTPDPAATPAPDSSTTGILEQSALETNQTVDMNNTSYTTLATTWLPLIIGIVAIVAILMTLAAVSSIGRKVRKLRDEIEEMQSSIDNIAQRDQRMGNNVKSFEKETERITNRLNEFEEILFDLKQRTGL
jgi:uncharacterized protein YukE